jgi:hypothetical protein
MMTYTRKTYRPGTTAIAAVLALSSTPLLAQEAPGTGSPAAEALAEALPPAPTTDAPAPAADPLAPAAEPTTPVDSTLAEATPEQTRAAPKTLRSAKKTARPSERPATTAAGPAATAPEPVIEPENSTSSPLESIKPAEIAAVPDARPVEKTQIDEAVPLAGGAGAVILALAGAGMAVRRRKRRQDEDGFDRGRRDETAMSEEPIAEPQPVWDPPVREPRAMAPAKIDQANAVSEDFDPSKFGRHVQAAYRGPTPQNPSLSLRKRLKIAGELDRRERESGEIAEMAKTAPPASREEPVIAKSPQPLSLSFSYSGNPTQVKWPEKRS